MRDSLGYTDKIKKLSKNDSKLIELKNPLRKKMRRRVWGYTNGEYLYMLVDSSLKLKYIIDTIKLPDDALEA